MSQQSYTNTVFMPPEAKIINLNNFDLSLIEKTFKPAPFERRISKMKVHKIANAIMGNQFTDNVLRCVNGTGSVQYEILDGQHRVEGLRYARETFGLQSYDLILFVYSGVNQREIYRRLNLGKPLTLTDHLKALDNGKQKFFNQLRKECDHYTAVDKFRFSTIINCLQYAKSTSIRAIKPTAIDDFLVSVTDNDIANVRSFLPILQQIATNPDSMFYHYTIMRNLFRIYYENNITKEKMLALGDILKNAPKVKEMAEKRDTFAMRGIYHYIIDIAAPKIDLNLSKGDVT